MASKVKETRYRLLSDEKFQPSLKEGERKHYCGWCKETFSCSGEYYVCQCCYSLFRNGTLVFFCNPCYEEIEEDGEIVVAPVLQRQEGVKEADESKTVEVEQLDDGRARVVSKKEPAVTSNPVLPCVMMNPRTGETTGNYEPDWVSYQPGFVRHNSK